MQGGAEGQEAQVCAGLICPSFPALNAALRQCSSLARDGEGWCCAGFGKSPTAAPGGSRRSPAAWHRGTGPLCARTALRGHRPWGQDARATAQPLPQQLCLLGDKEPIPAEVPQPCRAKGLVAHPTKKGTAACPTTRVRNDTTLHQNYSYNQLQK